jgi:hypothetical protein
MIMLTQKDKEKTSTGGSQGANSLMTIRIKEK